MNVTVAAFKQLWHSREARERKLVSIAAGVLVVAGVYGFVLDPAWTGFNALKTSLPAAQANAAQVQALAQHIKANPSLTAPTNAASLQQSLSAANINATTSPSAPWVVTVNSASGEALWAWLQTHKAVATQLKRSNVGVWSGQITLE
jgi:type II secretory pathway component PulM